MTATEQIENLKVALRSSAKGIRCGLNAPVLFGTFGVLLALFATGFVPRWRANTALAMIIGMVPMALGLGEGGEQNAPLGRAVIGGLLLATVATLSLCRSCSV